VSAVRGLLITLWLTVLWLALWADVSVANVLAGVAVSGVVLWSSKGGPSTRQASDEAPRIAVLSLIYFVGWVLVKLVQSNLVLAWEIVTPRNRIHTGVIAVPMRTDSRAAFLVVGNVITLTPGTLTIEVVGSPPTIYVHVLHLRDVERVRRDLQRVEHLAVRAFGSSRSRSQLVVAESDASSEGSLA
jgi:multicomponent Na+:H+ antiporter subunit E